MTAEPNDETPLVAVKRCAMIPLSEDTLMDEGLIPDTRPPVRVPLRRRISRRIRDAVTAVRLRLGAAIAGVDLTDWDEL